MIEKGWFLEGHVDAEETCLITSNETYQQYLETQKQLELRKQEADPKVQLEENMSPEAQEVLRKGNEFLIKIRKSNDAIPGEEISAKISRMELIVQKAVELGVYGIVPFAAKRSVVRLDEKKAGKKQIRWQAIAKGAAEQSGRGLIPEVEIVKTYAEALEFAKELDVILVPYELEEGMKATMSIIEAIRPGQSVGIFIGPEGGFEEQEIGQARNAGAVPVTLGRRILRTETAGITTLSILMYHLECAEVQ